MIWEYTHLKYIHSNIFGVQNDSFTFFPRNFGQLCEEWTLSFHFKCYPLVLIIFIFYKKINDNFIDVDRNVYNLDKLVSQHF